MADALGAAAKARRQNTPRKETGNAPAPDQVETRSGHLVVRAAALAAPAHAIRRHGRLEMNEQTHRVVDRVRDERVAEQDDGAEELCNCKFTLAYVTHYYYCLTVWHSLYDYCVGTGRRSCCTTRS